MIKEKEELVYLGNRVPITKKKIIERHAKKTGIKMKNIIEKALDLYIKNYKLK